MPKGVKGSGESGRSVTMEDIGGRTYLCFYEGSKLCATIPIDRAKRLDFPYNGWATNWRQGMPVKLLNKKVDDFDSGKLKWGKPHKQSKYK